ncbi:MAG TPA: hypothetical protein VF245_00795 [Solirubrobacterales bacterium]
MTEFNNEPLWVGMDVDAVLARYAEEDRRRAEDEAVAASPRRRPSRRRDLGIALPTLGRGGVPRIPLAA